jgi:lipopolysaccharide heptosyltransferase I
MVMAGMLIARYMDQQTHMANILFIKTSSLGDVVHHMPALTDARKAHPDATFSWLVEEAFAPLVRLHPAANKIIPVAWRRWRKSPYAPATIAKIRASFRNIRAQRYDEVVDTQGLLRTAILTRAARGRRHGYDASSAREPLASLFYDVRHRVDRNLHAVERNRILTGLALGYSPHENPDFGLDRAAIGTGGSSRYGVLLHATARPEKQWPDEFWIAFGRAFAQRVELILPWGTEVEHARSEFIAAAVPGARVTLHAPLDQVAKLIAGAQFVVGVDTGLMHLAAALGVPLVAIFTGSKPGLTGPVGRGRLSILGDDGKPPSPDAVIEAVENIIR